MYICCAWPGNDKTELLWKVQKVVKSCEKVGQVEMKWEKSLLRYVDNDDRWCASLQTGSPLRKWLYSSSVLAAKDPLPARPNYDRWLGQTQPCTTNWGNDFTAHMFWSPPFTSLLARTARPSYDRWEWQTRAMGMYKDTYREKLLNYQLARHTNKLLSKTMSSKSSFKAEDLLFHLFFSKSNAIYLPQKP